MVTRILLLLTVVLVSFPTSSASAQEGTGMQTFVSADITGAFNTSKSDESAKDSLTLREAEFAFFGPIDHTFDGMLSLAAHNEEGLYLVEVHEAHIGSSKLIPRSRFRLGKFFLTLGPLNRIHRHDWPFISAPKVHAEFFDDEGVADSGLEYSVLLPTPFFLDLTIGATNGWTYGHAHTEGTKPRQPNQYVRLATYSDLPAKGGMQVGVNGLKRMPDDGGLYALVGMDVVAKWRRGKVLAFLLQAEYWQRTFTPKEGDKESTQGAYVYPQFALTDTVSAGSRFDYFSIVDQKDAAGDKVDNHVIAFAPTFTYKNSEFATFKLAYIYEEQKTADEKTMRQTAEVQSTFILGAHPAHEF